MGQNVESNVNINVTGDISDITSKLNEVKRLEESLGQGTQFEFDSNGNIVRIQTELEALKASLESSNTEVYSFSDALNNIQNNGSAIDSYTMQLDALSASLGSNSNSIVEYTDMISSGFNSTAESTSTMNNNIKEAANQTQDVSKETVNVGTAVSSIITGLNQGLELVEKIAGAVADISEIAEEINQTLFEMSTVLGSEITQDIVEYTDAMQSMYGLDGTTMLNQLGDISTVVSKMGLSSSDALAVTENLGNFAQDLGAITGEFDKVYSDIAKALKNGNVRVGSALYGILNDSEVDELKNLNTEIERFNYLMSKSDRVNGTFEQFLETSNGKIYLLRQSFESLKSNVAAFANAAYAAVAPVLTNIIQGLNSILSKLITLFNIGYEAPEGMSGIASSFTDAAEEIGDAADSAKKSVLSFDDVITLDKDTSGGGSGLGDILGVDTIDTGKISSAIEQTRTRLDELIDHFKTGWDNAWDVGKAEKAISDIKKNISGISTELSKIWNDPNVQSAITDFENQAAQTFGAITGAATVTGLNIAAGLTGGTKLWLETDSQHIKDKIVDLANSATDLGKEVEQAAYNFADFSTVFNSEGFIDLTASMERLGFDIQTEATIIGNKAATAILTGFNAIWDVSGEDIKSACETTFGDVSDLINGLDLTIQGLGEDTEKVFNEILIPLSKNLGDTIGKYIVTPICNWWEEDIAPIFSEVGEKIKELWNEHLQPLFNDLFPYMQLCAQYFNIIMVLVGGLVQLIVATVGPAISNLISGVLTLFINIIEDIIDLVRGLADIIIGIFTADKDKIIEGLKTVGKAVVNAVIDVINSALSSVVGAINGLIGGINTVISWAGGSNIPKFDNETFKIPRLATGGIITSSTIANVGEDGAEAIVPLERNKGWMKVMAKEIASQMNINNSNENKNNSNVTIDMSKCTKEYYTKSEMIAMGELFAKCLKQAGMNVAVV